MLKSRKYLWLLIVIFLFCFCKKSSPTSDVNSEAARQIVILYTNDEHGWMEPCESSAGAAGMMGLWREKEGYTENGPFLILSGGDMWTGPAISTWFNGQSMAEVMNAMDYTAAAIGNHEFDFKVEGLKERLEQSNFPFLAANIQEKATGNIAEFAVPYIVKEVNNVKVGIIGLASVKTPTTAFPDFVQDYDFTAYDEALVEYLPKVRQDGAELIIVVGHICEREMRDIASTAAQFDIPVIFGGHCHEIVNDTIAGVTIVEANCNMINYARVEILFDNTADKVMSIKKNVYPNIGGTPDIEVESIVSYWQGLRDEALSEVIGYVTQTIAQHSDAMYNMISDSWLFSYPTADISITNTGGIRQSIPAGDIQLATIVGVLPFENNIVQLELNGTELEDCLSSGGLVVGGMTTIGGYSLSDGTPIYSDTVYSVLTTDYLYSSREEFKLYDTEPYSTSIHWRQPVIDWIKSLNTSASNPLDQYLDNTPRQ